VTVRIGLSLAVGAGTILTLVLWRGFFLQHALIVGVAAAALVFTGWGTLARLRALYRPPDRP
jgi:hypothetical protein